MDRSPVLIAGAGIAGLTAAIALAARGFPVRIFERAPSLDEAGAGVQLSPNATRILARQGVLDRLMPMAVRPEAVVLKSAATLAPIAHVPLGKGAEARWGAPYLVVHRADLQAAALSVARENPLVELSTGAAVRGAAVDADGVTARIDRNGTSLEARGRFLVAADGVWSALRPSIGGGASRFSGLIAWRATATGGPGIAPPFPDAPDAPVTAFLHPGFHLVSYPLRGGKAVNLVAVTRGGPPIGRDWSETGDLAALRQAMTGAASLLRGLPDRAGPWTAFPVHVAPPGSAWRKDGRLVLIGDAAHAMTPFAAQGAAMAIEDAAVLARCIAASDDTAGALARYEALRRPRIARVARRGAFNGFAWHASGPVGLARNLILKAAGPSRLAAGLDWLYGYDAQ